MTSAIPQPSSSRMLIKNLRSKIDTLSWYAKRPAYYGELLRKLVHREFSTKASLRRRDDEKLAGQKWCSSLVLPAEQALAALGLPTSVPSVDSLHPGEWQAAIRAVETCPVKMGGPADLAVLYHLVRHLPAKSVIETGVASGWSSLAILLALREAGGGRLTSIDMPYAKLNNEQYVGIAVPDELRAQWTLVRKSDRDALEPELERLGAIDLAHYDSDKSAAGRSFAYPRLWAALRKGGILMSDDIEDNLAFRDFASKIGVRPWVLEKKPGNYAGLLVK